MLTPLALAELPLSRIHDVEPRDPSGLVAIKARYGTWSIHVRVKDGVIVDLAIKRHVPLPVLKLWKRKGPPRFPGTALLRDERVRRYRTEPRRTRLTIASRMIAPTSEVRKV
jgi:hypothetical protein